MQVGKIVFIQIRIVITTNGTGATYIDATLPVTPTTETFVLPGRAALVSGKMLQGFINNSAHIAIYNYDNSYPAVDGESLTVSGIYEAA